jgi:transposase InsO family protein
MSTCKAGTRDNTWYVDSAATTHLTFNKELFDSIEPTTLTISLADGSPLKAIGVGIASIPLIIEGKTTLIKLSGVHYCPGVDSNLISAGLLESKGLSWIAKDGLLLLKDPNGATIIESRRRGLLYAVNQPTFGRVMKIETASNQNLWHRRLGHLGYQDLKRLENMTEEISIDNHNETTFCEVCVLTKKTRNPHKGPSTRATTPFERIHIDLCGGGATLPSKGGIRYFMLFTDDYTRYKYVYFLKSKDEARHVIKDFIAKTRTQFGKTVTCFRSDNAQEFKETDFQKFIGQLGIQWEWSAPYAHGQNGVAERINRTLATRTRSLLKDSNLSEGFWVEAMKTAAYLLNRSPTSFLKITPYEGLTGSKPDLSDLHVFGCNAYVYDEKRATKKLSDRSWKGVFLGYEGKHQYRIYNPANDQVYVRRDVKFNETPNAVTGSDITQDPNTTKHWNFSEVFTSPFLVDDYQADDPKATVVDDNLPTSDSAKPTEFYDAIEDQSNDQLHEETI